MFLTIFNDKTRQDKTRCRIDKNFPAQTGVTNHTAAYSCIFLVNQSIKVYILGLFWLELSLSNHGDRNIFIILGISGFFT